MNFSKENLTRAFGRKVLIAKKNSPHIFFVAGIIGVVGSTILACRATLKLEENLDEIKKDFQSVKEMHKEPYSEKNHRKDLSYVYGKSSLKLVKLYAPAVVVGGASIAALTGSHLQLTHRNTALTVTLAAVSKAYEEYRERIKEELGEKRELEIYQNLDEKTINGKKELVSTKNSTGYSPYARFFDEYCLNWRKEPELNRIFLDCQQNYANHMLKARGHVFLNDVYDSLGLERSQAGAVVGWVMNGEGDNYIDFGMFDDSSRRFINNFEPSILLDFNVDGIVYDKI